MTLSSRALTNAPISTLLNLSTRYQSFMVLHNPNRVVRRDWFWSVQIMEWTLATVKLSEVM